MILTLSDLVLGVLLVSFLLVGGFSVVSRFMHLRRERVVVRGRVVCRLCGHVYVAGEHEKVGRCEMCGAKNLRSGNGKLG